MLSIIVVIVAIAIGLIAPIVEPKSKSFSAYHPFDILFLMI